MIQCCGIQPLLGADLARRKRKDKAGKAESKGGQTVLVISIGDILQSSYHILNVLVPNFTPYSQIRRSDIFKSDISKTADAYRGNKVGTVT